MTIAKQSANFSREVAMVYIKPSFIRLDSADRATAALSSEQLLVVNDTKAIFLSQVVISIALCYRLRVYNFSFSTALQSGFFTFGRRIFTQMSLGAGSFNFWTIIVTAAKCRRTITARRRKPIMFGAVLRELYVGFGLTTVITVFHVDNRFVIGKGFQLNVLR